MTNLSPEIRAITLIRDEVTTALNAVSEQDLIAFGAALRKLKGRLYFSGQGRSGLVAQMAAMRGMHLGFETHFVSEVTAPAIRQGDMLVLFSKSGTTEVSLHYARIAQCVGAELVVVCGDRGNPLSQMARRTMIVPATPSQQFSGSLFEQMALLMFDTVVKAIALSDDISFTMMQARHTNLQ